MTQTTEIRCDACEADITYTGNSEDYRLVLASQIKTPWYVREGTRGGAVTDMSIPDPLPQSRHFCGLQCLGTWVERLASERKHRVSRTLRNG